MPRPTRLLFASVFSVASGLALAQSADDMNKANNPLAPTIGVNLQDQYVGSYYGLDDVDSNAFLLRGTLPHKAFGLPQIFRYTLPFATSPNIAPDGRTTNVGDLNVFDVAVFKAGGVEIGIGPQLTVPSAGSDRTGTGKWQAGVATLVISPKPWGLIGGLVTWQRSFSGSGQRTTQDNLQAQPLVIYNLPRGWYLRTTATWAWDLEGGTHYVPVGFGTGKVWRSKGGVTYNLFAEPQFTVARHGDGVPQFQLFFGLNMQFPMAR